MIFPDEKEIGENVCGLRYAENDEREEVYRIGEKVRKMIKLMAV